MESIFFDRPHAQRSLGVAREVNSIAKNNMTPKDAQRITSNIQRNGGDGKAQSRIDSAAARNKK